MHLSAPLHGIVLLLYCGVRVASCDSHSLSGPEFSLLQGVALGASKSAASR